MREFTKLFIRRFLKEYGWLFALAKEYRCSSILLDEIRRLVERSQQVTSEKERFSFSLALETSRASLSPANLVVQPFHLWKLGRLADFKNVVDGINICYQVDSAGLLRMVQIPIQHRKADPDLTMKELSAAVQTLTVYVGLTLARMYSRGILIRTWRKGTWLEYPKLDFDEFAREGYPEKLLSTVLAHCVVMSESSKAGALVVQKGDTLESCESFRDIHFAECDFYQIPVAQLIGYAEMDGAIVISARGRILAVAQRLIYREVGSGTGGARHESASRYSAEHECMIFVVSSDGPISVFKAGKPWKRFFAELKP